MPKEADAKLRMISASVRMLAEGQGARAFDRAQVAAAANLSEHESAQLFADDHGYRLALAGHLMNEVREEAIGASVKMAPGVERMHSATSAYLDANFRRPWLRELLDAVAQAPDSARIRQVRNHGYVLVFQIEFIALGVNQVDASGAAHVAMALVQETVRAEREAGANLPAFRELIFDYMRSVATGVQPAARGPGVLDFAALGAPNPQAAARLYAAALFEASEVERAAGRALPGLQRGLERFVSVACARKVAGKLDPLEAIFGVRGQPIKNR